MGKKSFSISDREVEVEILSLTSDQARLSIQGQVFDVKLSSLLPSTMTMICNAKKWDCCFSDFSRGVFLISHDGGEVSLSETQRPSFSKTLQNHRTHSPMPGKVIKIFVHVGEEVDEGAPLVAIEAMKMEHVLRARRKSVVKELLCQEGDTVQGQVSLLSLE
jgi:acetyl/propionyl-CoA carboxylase alpha subunit